jgi:surface antigen
MEYAPRLNTDGMSGNPKWYSRNLFYQCGYGLPNCTCYAWGRWWEISDPNNQFINRPNLSTGNGRDWWAYNISHNYYEYGQTPKLGAVICFTNSNPTTNGHVGVVEEIHSDYIVTSNSEWGGRYFYLEQLKLGSDNRYHHYGF